MAELWDDLLACLDLAEASADRAFEGKNLPLDYHRLFGGQLLAQFAVAAAASCPGKSVKSLHALFPREGTAEEPVCGRGLVDRRPARTARPRGDDLGIAASEKRE